MEKPLVYAVDTPGVMVPRISNFDDGLRLIATGAVKSDRVDPDVVAEFIFEQMGHRPEFRELYRLPALPAEDAPAAEGDAGAEPTPVDLNDVLQAVARRYNIMAPGGRHDLDAAAIRLANDFREGKHGLVVMDDVSGPGREEWLRRWKEVEIAGGGSQAV
ncbi:hypothetical protein H696_01902 [Fonticula alba]|uniref:G domain-containing protein n=1 Tax=Fonticula alba TaxID=691883 RepID=A0A058Z9N6_FONAL|nr:hypothetical protein H696_01902 [Fonticula alba]KCV70955.1 hypothetical protein H696_01902 [Fonticula alba]|eukprot:XP_009494078.1 hypothetical protein H696_01902 [Fonticula alba]